MSQHHNVSENELQLVAPKIKEYISNQNDAVWSEIEKNLEQRPGLLGILFPGKLKSEYEKLSVQKLKDSYAVQKLMTEAYAHALIELVKKEGDMMIKQRVLQFEDILAKDAVKYRTEITAYVQTSINNMSDIFKESRTQFLARMDQQYDEGEKYKHRPHLYSAHAQSLNKETDIFMATIEELLQGFKDALKKKLE